MLKISLGEGSDKRAHKHLSSFSGWEILSDFIASIGTAGGSNERVLDGSYVPRRMGRDQTSAQRQEEEARVLSFMHKTCVSHVSVMSDRDTVRKRLRNCSRSEARLSTS